MAQLIVRYLEHRANLNIARLDREDDERIRQHELECGRESADKLREVAARYRAGRF